MLRESRREALPCVDHEDVEPPPLTVPRRGLESEGERADDDDEGAIGSGFSLGSVL